MTAKKQALYDATTKARNDYHSTYKNVEREVKKANPFLKWFEVMDLVEKDLRVVKASERLYALCDACNILGIESGE